MIAASIFFGLVVGFFAGGLLVEKWSKEDAEDEAVKAGKAEYYLDENNQRKWRWK